MAGSFPLNPSGLPPWMTSTNPSWMNTGLYANPTQQSTYTPAPSPFGPAGALGNWGAPVQNPRGILDTLLGLTQTPTTTPNPSPPSPSGTVPQAGGNTGGAGAPGSPAEGGSPSPSGTGESTSGSSPGPDTSGSGSFNASPPGTGFSPGIATPAGSFFGNVPGVQYGFNPMGPNATSGLLGQLTNTGVFGNAALNALTLGIPGIGIANSLLGTIGPNMSLHSQAQALNALQDEAFTNMVMHTLGLSSPTAAPDAPSALAQTIASNLASSGSAYGGGFNSFAPGTELSQSNLPQGTKLSDIQNLGKTSLKCFPGETLVLTGAGVCKPIKDIRTSDPLLSYNWKTKTVESRPVSRVRVPSEVVQLIELNKKLRVTGYHKFALPVDNVYIQAQKIHRGDVLLGLNGPVLVESIETQSVDPTLVYNLSVSHNHNFFVFDGSEYYLVHNGGGGGNGGDGAGSGAGDGPGPGAGPGSGPGEGGPGASGPGPGAGPGSEGNTGPAGPSATGPSDPGPSDPSDPSNPADPTDPAPAPPSPAPPSEPDPTTPDDPKG